MPSNKVLSENFLALMRAHPRLWTYRLITAAGGGSNGTLDRIKRQDGNTGINQLDMLAETFRVDAWQLLVPDLDPANPPRLVDASPLAADLAKMFDAIVDEDQRRKAYSMCVQLMQFARQSAAAPAPIELVQSPTLAPSRGR